MQIPSSRMLAVLLAYLAAETQAYPMQSWPMYAHAPREYPEEDYYYSPKTHPYYDTQAAPEVYGQVPYSYDSYTNNFEMPKGHEERIAALPIGQEMWYENETPHWQNNDVNAAFLNNLILTQMAQDAQDAERRRENARAEFASNEYETEETERDAEDEDVRELKALAGKPFYHVPKTVPRIDDEEEDYASDEADDGDSFINWNGNKRSIIVTTAAPTTRPKAGQKEVMVPGGQTHKTLQEKQHEQAQNHVFYNTISKLLKNSAKNSHEQQEQPKGRRIEKRFVSGDNDLVFELRGLKRRVAT